MMMIMTFIQIHWFCVASYGDAKIISDIMCINDAQRKKRFLFNCQLEMARFQPIVGVVQRISGIFLL